MVLFVLNKVFSMIVYVDWDGLGIIVSWMLMNVVEVSLGINK